MQKYGFILIFLSLGACGVEVTSPFEDEHRAKAAENFNASEMIASLDEVRRWHRTNQTELVSALNPGKERADILEEFSDSSCQPTEELVQLWGWHNGTKDVATPFIWYHNSLSMEKAKSEYQRLTKNPLIGWHKNWMPVFEFEGEWYFVECYKDRRQASPVGYYFLEDPEAYYVYLNLSKMLETSVVWFNQNAVTWDKEQQGMKEDLKKVFEIHQTINEGADFPYYVE